MPTADPLHALCAHLPRYPLALTPTPVEPMPRLSAALGVPLSVKRDDLSGMAFGGNKLRQLEYYVGQALQDGATTLLVSGAVQSNYARAVAAVAARAGLRAHIQLEQRVDVLDPVLNFASGNMLVNSLLNAAISIYPHRNDEHGADAAISAIADDLRSKGERPYLISLKPQGASLGAVGYLHAATELLAQCPDADTYVLASGSGQTQAGLLFGLRLLGSDARVIGMCVRRDAAAQRERVAWHCRYLAELLGVESPVCEHDIQASDTALGQDYGLPEPHVLDAMREAATQEGLLLDPVYTGKAFAGLLADLRTGGITPRGRVVFIHTGGMPALFAYAPQVMTYMADTHGAKISIAHRE